MALGVVQKASSTLPSERMASGVDDWEAVMDNIRNTGNGDGHDRLGSDVVVQPGGRLACVPSGLPSSHGQPMSTLPPWRMAAGNDWDSIFRELRQKENGERTGTELVVQPGGQLVRVLAGQPNSQGTPVSRLPEDRMAATNVVGDSATRVIGPSTTDAIEIRELDPRNVESWRIHEQGGLSGWSFALTPPITPQKAFRFFVWRSPSEGNALRITAVEPYFGKPSHEWHIIRIWFGRIEVPVICATPGARPARNFAEVRGQAAKWTTYVSLRLAGIKPGFSE